MILSWLGRLHARPRPGEGARVEQVWNAGLLACGELIVKLNARVASMGAGERLRLVSLDPASMDDIPAWCRLTGHLLLQEDPPTYIIMKQQEG